MQSTTFTTGLERMLPRVFYVFLALFCTIMLLFFTLADFRTVILITPDDAYYFLMTAENMAAGHGMTFDGLNLSNGFQPLWLLMIVPLFSFIKTSPETLTRICLVLQILMVAITSLLFFDLLRRILSAGAAFVGSLVFLVWVGLTSVNAMESAALIATLVLMGYYGWKQEVFTRFRLLTSFAFGILLGITMLGRLDMVFLAMAVFVMAAYPVLTDSSGRRDHVLRTLLLGVGFMVVLTPYLLYNHIVFGAMMPISGQLKSTFPEISLTMDSLGKVSKVKLLAGLFALAYIVRQFLARREWSILSQDRKYFRGALTATSVYVVFHLAHTLLYMHWGVYNWHFIAYNLFLAALVAELIDNLSRRFPIRVWRVSYSALVGVLVLVTANQLVGLGVHNRRNPFNQMTYEAAVWIRENTRKDAIVAIKDAGTFGYFCRRRTINLDGLVNDINFQYALRDQRLKKYLDDFKVSYLAIHAYTDYPKLSGDYTTYTTSYWSRLFGLHPIFWSRYPLSLGCGLGLFVLKFVFNGGHVA